MSVISPSNHPSPAFTDRQCDGRCTQRWKGCSCHKHTANKPQKCSSNKCECRQAGRECNSAVCVGCGTWSVFVCATCTQADGGRHEIDSGDHEDECEGSRPKPKRKGPNCQNRATLRAPRAVSHFFVSLRGFSEHRSLIGRKQSSKRVKAWGMVCTLSSSSRKDPSSAVRFSIGPYKPEQR
jgi:hypothetical protein